MPGWNPAALRIRQLTLRLPMNRQWRQEFVDRMWTLWDTVVKTSHVLVWFLFLEYRRVFYDFVDSKNNQKLQATAVSATAVDEEQLEALLDVLTLNSWSIFWRVSASQRLRKHINHLFISDELCIFLGCCCWRRRSSRGGCHGRRARGGSCGGTTLLLCFHCCLNDVHTHSNWKKLVKMRGYFSIPTMAWDPREPPKGLEPWYSSWQAAEAGIAEEPAVEAWILDGMGSYEGVVVERNHVFCPLTFDGKSHPETLDWSWRNWRQLQSRQPLRMKSNQTSS